MADNTDIIKEFLVSLGFKVDDNTLSKFGRGLQKATEMAVEYAAVVTAAATATAVFVDKVASGLADLYWASVRTRDSVANIKDFQLSIKEMGGDADAALGSLEGIAHYLRTNPAGESFMKYLGIQTRDAEGHLRGASDLLKQLANLPLPYWLKVRFAERFGIDENTLQATIRGAGQTQDAIHRMYSAAGIDATKAAEASKDFKNQTYEMEAAFGVLATVLEVRLLPMAKALTKWVEGAVLSFIALDNETGGWLSTISGGAIGTILALAAAVAAVGFAIKIAATAIRVLRLAWAALNLLFLETPIGWIVLALAALAYAAYQVIKHWDTVKAYYNDLVGWFREKYNAIAKYLGLPQWTEEPPSRAVSPGTGRPRSVGEQQTPANQNAAGGGAGGAGGAVGAEPSAGGGVFQEGDNYSTANREGDNYSTANREGDNYSTVYGGATYSNNWEGDTNTHIQQVPQTVPTQEPVPGYEGALPQQVATGKALAFFQKMGRTAEQSAGIVANLLAESKLNPNAVGDNGQAYGIAQWHKDRQAEFAKWAGHDIHGSSLEEQLRFVHYEMTKGAEQLAGKLLAAAQTAAKSGYIVSKFYERPGLTKEEQNRQAFLRSGLAAKLSNAHLGTASGNKSVVLNQKTDITVNGATDAHKTANTVGKEQGRVNGDLARNFAGSAW